MGIYGIRVVDPKTDAIVFETVSETVLADAEIREISRRIDVFLDNLDDIRLYMYTDSLSLGRDWFPLPFTTWTRRAIRAE